MKYTAFIEGGQVPNGTITVSGAKNSATRLLAASLISDGEVVLKNFPVELVDAKHKVNFIKKSGGDVRTDSKQEVISINSNTLSNKVLDDYNYPIRTTYLLVPGLVKKTGSAKIPYPGGCKIGNRGYDLHIMVWEKLGATVVEKDDFIEVNVDGGFKANEINFPITTIGGTESALICGSIAKGTTIIKNAYISPEVEDLIKFLISMGVEINVVGNSYIEVIGQEYHSGANYHVMPDRIEALTWLVFGVLSKGNITIKDVPFHTMNIPLKHIKEAGIDFFANSKDIYVSENCLTNGIIQPFELATGTHPGVISDMQPFYVLLGLYADGKSKIYDYRYPERVKYCEELAKIYKNAIQWSHGKIETNNSFIDREDFVEVESTDLRGSMALVIAALLTNGKTKINNVEMALRGYNNLKYKLESLGINITIEES